MMAKVSFGMILLFLFSIWLLAAFTGLIYPLLKLIFPHIFVDPPRGRDTEIPYARLKSQYAIALKILREQGIEEDTIIETLKKRERTNE